MVRTTTISALLFLVLASCDRSSPPAVVVSDGSAHSSTSTTQTAMASTNPSDKVTHTDAEWRKLLTPEQYAVLRQKGTERAFTGEYTDKEDSGTYLCAAC